MKILVVLESYPPNIGGVEQLFGLLCEGFTARGHAVTVVTTRCAAAPSYERSGGVEIRRLRTASRYLFSFVSIFTLLRMAAAYDIILTTSYNAALPAWIVARWRRKKIIVTFHEVWGALWFRLPFIGPVRKTGYYLFEQLLLRLRFDRFVAVSHATARRLREYGIEERNITMIYNGVDYEQFLPYRHHPQGAFTYCYFGRLGLSKGLDLLIPAAARFAERRPDSRLKLIIPTTPRFLYKKIISLIGRYKLNSHIERIHALPKRELYRTLIAAHCVVIPSCSEGFCFAAVEAAGLGVPVIASDRGALPEVISGKHITLDTLSPDSLCDALTRALHNQWDHADEKIFDVHDTIQHYLTLMEQVGEGGLRTED